MKVNLKKELLQQVAGGMRKEDLDRCNQAIELANQLGYNDLAQKIKKSMLYWDPNIVPEKLTYLINDYVIPSASDENSIKMYSFLMDTTEEDTRNQFLANGDK